MASDTEEDFESADEDFQTQQRSEKHDDTPQKPSKKNSKSDDKPHVVSRNVENEKEEPNVNIVKESEGWDNDWNDFDIDNSEQISQSAKNVVVDTARSTLESVIPKNPNNEDAEEPWDDFNVENSTEQTTSPVKNVSEHETKPPIPTKSVQNKDNKANEGWDDFNDWDDEDHDSNSEKDSQNEQSSNFQEHTEKEYKALADRLSSMGETSPGTNSGWSGWGGWGVTNLLTSGVTQLTSHVSQGFATVSQALESGIGVPDPAELAQSQKKANEKQLEENTRNRASVPSNQDANSETEKKVINNESDNSVRTDNNARKEDDTMGVFKFGKLVSNVTKLVETTGSAVMTGGLDTLEEIGKRTIRVLQGEEDGKKRLSTLLREARDKIEESPPSADASDPNPKKQIVKFEALFDDFQGLVHLEALEMLSKQCDMKLQSLLTSYEGQELVELKETLDQVKDICELPDSDEDDEKDDGNAQLSSETLKNKLKESIKDMGVQLQFDAIIICWDNIIADANVEGDEESTDEEKLEQTLTEKAEDVMRKAITNLAHSSAISVQLLHKTTALLSVRERRSTADEADGLTQLTAVLSSHMGEIAALYSQRLNEFCKRCKKSENINGFITNVFLEAGKASSYIQDAFHLTIPILQVGAI